MSQQQIKYFHIQSYQCSGEHVPVTAVPLYDHLGYQLLPDVKQEGIFMMQMVPSEEESCPLLVFYDSGCSSAVLSDKTHYALQTIPVTKGPTSIDVAGGRTITVPNGDERFHLEVEGKGKVKATITGLRMPHVTTPFPVMQLMEAWQDACAQAKKDQPSLTLPTVDAEIGGREVDILLGIKYIKYFPKLVYTLPSGLQVYRAVLKSATRNQAVLGGPHQAWSRMVEQAQHMNPRAYLTAEAKAWYVEEKWARINQGKLSALEMFKMEESVEEAAGRLIETDTVNHGCLHCRCEEPSENYTGIYSASKEEKNFWKVEDLGTESPYRCIDCRSCTKCRNGDELEAISFKEEAEQHLIEASVELDPVNHLVWAKLPFILDPFEYLRENRFIAEKVLQTQMQLFSKNPSAREDTLKSHQKLLDRGHVLWEEDLPAAFKEAIKRTPGPGYFIPWRIVHNEGSLSTPCRMVFDASSKTPGGESLNGCLAKGKNRLCKIQHLLLRFRKGREALSADISMAYNGTKLHPDHLKYQKYLWRDNLEPKDPVKVMYVCTLIYGVKPSGQQCQVSLEKLAGDFRQKGICLDGAEILEKDVYVDDILTSTDSMQDSIAIAQDIETILARGSMGVKAFTYSGVVPDERVSADGIHVGIGGYLWRPVEDTIQLDVGPPRLGKARRGKRPPPITGDFGKALRTCFTRRTLTGLVASVFDPLGLVTPITAGFKLDLHELCGLKLDWDDPVPEELLSKWVSNMEQIQELKTVVFRRTVIPDDAENCKVELLTLTDASQNLGIVAIFGRVKRKGGQFSCQLLMGRSKLLSGLTIPKAEMKAAVAGATSASVVRRNFGNKFAGQIFCTDSTVCLYWITQQEKPLQVGVRNAVAEVRRFSETSEWFHVQTNCNVADIGTRPASVSEILPGTPWQDGYSWMTLPRDQMPLKTAEEVTLTAEERRQAASEVRGPDIRGHQIHILVSEVSERYAFSKYVLDPCRLGWSKSLRVLALVWRFINRCRRPQGPEAKKPPMGQQPLTFSDQELQCAADYFFRLGTKEFKQFGKLSAVKNCSFEKDGILYFSGRLLDSSSMVSTEKVLFDISPVSFVKPILEQNSPISYALMIDVHWNTATHRSPLSTYRHSLELAYIVGGRSLAQEIRDSCPFCKRARARLIEVEMGKIPAERLFIAPAFSYCQVDLFGPFLAKCEHNHRSTVKLWGAAFKCNSTGALAVHVMSDYSTDAFLMAYMRFASRYGHPMKLLPDEGTQLIKACKDTNYSWIDITTAINAEFGVGFEYEAAPVGGHNTHGMVERSIREIRRLFEVLFKSPKYKLDLLSYETCFQVISNNLNNLPICTGPGFKDLAELDFLTPNRLLLGRNNRRCLSGPCTVDDPSKMLESVEAVYQSWWGLWNEFRLSEFVAKPPKWYRSSANLEVGDIVIFVKNGSEVQLGQPVWTIGRVVEAVPSKTDGKVRQVKIEYSNSSEWKDGKKPPRPFRTTNRASRTVARLAPESELDLLQNLAKAAREASRDSMGDGVPAVLLPPEEKERIANYSSICTEFSGECQSQDIVGTVCNTLRIHADPWP
jgi:hypothetical protein